jgi:hypothetical protein
MASERFDPEVDAQFWALSAEARQIGAGPGVGKPEVERLAEIVEEMNAILDDLPEERLRRFRSRIYEFPGRTVNLPLPPLTPPTWPVGKIERIPSCPHPARHDHIHWAWDDGADNG